MGMQNSAIYIKTNIFKFWVERTENWPHLGNGERYGRGYF